MGELVLVLLAIIAIILTVWLVMVPAEVVVGFVKALRNGGSRRRKPQ
jgi:hypothetical protein